MPKLTVQEQFKSTQGLPRISGITWEWERRKWKVQFRIKNSKVKCFGRYNDFYEAYYTLRIAQDMYE